MKRELNLIDKSELKKFMDNLTLNDTFSSLVDRIIANEEGDFYGHLSGFNYNYVDDFINSYNSLISYFSIGDIVRFNYEKIEKLYNDVIDKLKDICEAFIVNYLINLDLPPAVLLNNICEDVSSIQFIDGLNPDEKQVIKDVIRIYSNLKSQEFN